MKKFLLVFISIFVCFLFTTTAFASEKTVSFANCKTKQTSKTYASFYGNDMILKSKKWCLCSGKIKVILEGGCKMKSQTFANGNTHVSNFNTGIRTYDKDGNSCDSFSGSIKEIGSWVTVGNKQRVASGYDQIDRSIGLSCNVNGVLRGETPIKNAKFEFSSTKGNYNGDAYDVICKITDDAGPVATVLYKDIKINDNDCTYTSLAGLSTMDIVDEDNNKVFAFAYPAGAKFSLVQFAAAGYLEKGYRTVYANDIQYYDNDIWLEMGQKVTDEDGTTYQDDGSVNIFGTYDYDDDNDEDAWGEPYFNSCSFTVTSATAGIFAGGQQFFQVEYGYAGILKPEKVYKGDKIVTPTYEYLTTPGTFKGIDYDSQFVMKDGSNIIGRIMIKNSFVTQN